MSKLFFVSSETHGVFFLNFMKWYSEVVFPLFFKMPPMEERSGGVGSGEHVVVHENCTFIPGNVAHAALKDMLITHFDVANRKGEVVWPQINGIVRKYYTASKR